MKQLSCCVGFMCFGCFGLHCGIIALRRVAQGRHKLLKLVVSIGHVLMVACTEAAYQSAFVRVQSVRLQSGLVERVPRMVNVGASEISVVAKDFGEIGFVPLKLGTPASDGSVDIPIGGSPIPISWITAGSTMDGTIADLFGSELTFEMFGLR